MSVAEPLEEVPMLAVSVTVVALDTETVCAVKFAVVAPGLNVTLFGTEAMAALLEESVTVRPPEAQHC